ncbi:MAG: hypothetical protein JRJ26_05120 [Deltaproteobacteria bacterium]|nr:hypothetical protein [Deltaproteobacteria bacterium]
MEAVNRLKKILDQGKVALGTAIFSYSPAVVEAAGYGGLDFLRIDNEYSWRRDESMEHMVRAATIAGITAIIRHDKGDHYLINKALEIGAGGILIPDVRTGEEVEQAIQAAKFPPRGTRGYSSMCFSGQWGARSGRDWVEWCDSQLLVGIMVENDEVITRLDEILSMEGLDFILFGPSDFSMSLGLRQPQKNHPKVQEALKRTIAVAAKHNKPVGIGVGRPWLREARKYIDMGCRIIEIGNDVALLRSMWTNLSGTIKTL